MGIRHNSEMTGVIAGVVVIVIGFLMILGPIVTGMDMMGGGYALIFGGFFVVLVGLVTTATFGYRAGRLVTILAGQHVLAHWVYDPALVESQAARDLRDARAANRIKFVLIAGFMVACIVLFTVYGYMTGEGESMPAFIGLMLSVLILVGGFALGVPYVQYRRALRSSGEAYIATNGLYVNGALHTWNAPLAALDEVAFVDDADGQRLVFHLRSRTSVGAGGYESYQVEVPVPGGEVETARRVEQYFGESTQQAV